MIPAAVPENEAMRLLDLASYELQDTDTEEDFDQLSELVAQYFNCPIALITVIDSDRQWFKGKMGTTETGNTRELSFCSHTLLTDDVMVVEDATKDERFFDNPVVAGEFSIRFYAGAPIVSTDGYKLGTVCIYDTKPGKLSASKKKALLLFSKQVTKLLELRKKNILLHQRAQELIALKSEVFARFIRGQEAEKKEIAFNLHEDFAQGIVASLMILNAAQKGNQPGMGLVKKAVDQLKEVLVSIRTLTYSITPTYIDWIAPDQLVLKYVEKIESAYPFKICVKSSGQKTKVSPDSTLCAIRIIEQWLKVLSRIKDIGRVNISVVYHDQFELLIEDNGSMESLNFRTKQVIESVVYERAHAEGGTVELARSLSDKNLLRVLLPLTNSSHLLD